MVTVINTVDTGHEDMVHDAQMDFYGTRLATCSSDRSVKVFDVLNGQQTLIATLLKHDGPVWQVAWGHPSFGTLLASCGYDRKVIIWKEMSDGSWSNYEYMGHDSSVNSISWAPSEFGLMLACGSSDGSLSILTGTPDGSSWEAKKISNAHTIGCNSVSWGPAVAPGALIDEPGSHSATPTPKRFVSGGCDNLVKIWREKADGSGGFEEEEKLEGHSDWVRDVAWAPSIGLPKTVIASCSQDCRVIIWTHDGTPGSTWQTKVLNKFSDVIWHVSWSITGNILAVSGGSNKVSLWKETLEGQWVCLSDMKDKGRATDQTDDNREARTA